MDKAVFLLDCIANVILSWSIAVVNQAMRHCAPLPMYSSKDDILNEYIETIFLAFYDELTKRGIHHYWEVVQLYFDFWEQRESVILLFKKHELLPVLMESSRNHADQIFSAVRSPETAAAFSPLLPYMLAYAVGGMHNMLVTWITSGKSVPSNVLIQNMKSGLQSPDI